MNSQSPLILSTMKLGELVGCQEVPEPIWPMNITVEALSPTRTPISAPDMTKSFCWSAAGPISMPGIWPIGLDDGLGAGMGICIGAEGEGELSGMGIFISAGDA